MNDRIAECDVRGRIARDSGKPTVAEAHIGKVDECGLPEQEAMKPKVNVRRCRALFHSIGRLKFVCQLVEQILLSLALDCWTLLSRLSTDINAIQLAECFCQGPSNNPRERSRTCFRRFELSADDKSLVLGPSPPQGRW